MTFPEYRAIPAVNWSTLRELSKSPADYKYRLANLQPDTPAMARGRLVHCAVLEPDELPRRYAVWNGARRGKDFGTFADIAIERGMEVVTGPEYERACAIRDAVRGNADAGPLLTGGEAEVTRTWTDTATGIPCKCRIDYLIGDTIVDLKTTQSIRKHDFARSCAMYQYHGQLAFYARSVETPKVYMVAVKSEPPHGVAAFEPDDDFMWAGDELVTELLTVLDKCRQNDTWPEMYSGVQSLSLPAWCFDAIEEVTK